MIPHSPLISIITICFNSEKFIEQCIQSVLSQDYDNFEYIVIDGGSTDNTVNIIQKYAAKIAVWQSETDRGISEAFNKGIDKSKGKWIAFLNSDDCYCDSKAISSMADTLLKQSNADLVYGQIQIVERKKEIVTTSPAVGAVWKWSTFRFRCTIPHPASFNNRDFLKKYGPFDENFRNAMDYELYLRAGKGLKVIFVQRLLVWMRDGGISKDDAYRSYRESRDAQIKNGTFGKTIAWMIYLLYIMRVFIGQRAAKF